MGNEIRAVLDAVANSPIPKIVIGIFAVFLLGTLAIGLVQHGFLWTDAMPPKGIASVDVWKLGMVVGTAGTATAFLVTLYVADRNYRRGREHVPNLSMDLQVRRIPVSLSYDAIMLTLDAKNTGSGLCDVNQVHWTIKALSPYDDDSVEDMQREFVENPSSDQNIEFPWHEVKEETTTLNIRIEPNETEQITHDFIIPATIDSVVVSAWVANASDPKLTEGWYRRTMQESKENQEIER